MSDVYQWFIEHRRGLSPFSELLNKQLERAVADMQWELNDHLENIRIGPQHRPGRREHWEACKHVRNLQRLRAMGRPAGEYRRTA